MKLEPDQAILELIIFSTVYFLAAKIGLLFSPVAGLASPIWPPTGIALAGLLICGIRLWPGITIAAFVVNYMSSHSIPVALGIASGNTLEAVVAFYFLKRYDFHRSLNRIRDVLALIGIAAFGSTFISAIIGVSTAWVFEVLHPRDYALALKIWWVGDALGDLVIAPFLLISWKWLIPSKINFWKISEETGIYLIVIALSALILSDWGGSKANYYLKPSIYYPILLWATFRFCQRGANTATLIISVMLTIGTAIGRGPFVGLSPTVNLFSLQLFIGSIAITFLLVGTLVTEWRRTIQNRDEILAIVSHDLKNPIGTILLNAQVLRHSLEQHETTEDLKKRIAIFERMGLQMKELVDNLLDAAKAESGTMSIESHTESAKRLVEESLEMFKTMANEKSIHLTVNMEDKGLQLYCDHDRTLQVLSNLIGNAVKFTPTGGDIALKVEAKGRKALFTIEDSGPGIDNDHLPHIFDRYWQGRKTGRDSIGLGLSIAKGIVEAQGGKISAENCKLKKGARLRFTLPVAESAREIQV